MANRRVGVSASSAGGVLFWDRLVRPVRPEVLSKIGITSEIVTPIRRYAHTPIRFFKVVEARIGCAVRASFCGISRILFPLSRDGDHLSHSVSRAPSSTQPHFQVVTRAVFSAV